MGSLESTTDASLPAFPNATQCDTDCEPELMFSDSEASSSYVKYNFPAANNSSTAAAAAAAVQASTAPPVPPKRNVGRPITKASLSGFSLFGGGGRTMSLDPEPSPSPNLIIPDLSGSAGLHAGVTASSSVGMHQQHGGSTAGICLESAESEDTFDDTTIFRVCVNSFYFLE